MTLKRRIDKFLGYAPELALARRIIGHNLGQNDAQLLCLPTKTDKLPSGSQWLHEIKHDGFRIIARKNGAQVRLRRRSSAASVDEELRALGT